MISEQLEQQAALYAAGVLTTAQRAEFELILEFHQPLQAFTNDLLEAVCAAVLATQARGPQPSDEVKTRLLSLLDDRVQHSREAGFVMAGPDTLVQWVNPAFTAMCGYELEELRGKKLGPILQGEHTCKVASARMRAAVHARQPCTEALINYHKNGTPYWVAINITPIHDAAGELLWYVARELELPERAVPA